LILHRNGIKIKDIEINSHRRKNIMSIYNYPAPCSPNYKKPVRTENCLPQARMLVKKEKGRGAMGPVKKGDNILIITFPDQDEYVKNAITEALKEEGAGKVNFTNEHEFSNGTPRVFSVLDGWREANTVENEPWDMSGSTFYSDVSENLRSYLTKNNEYTKVFFGLGGRNHLIFQLKEHFPKFKGCWLFNNWEEFLSRAWSYPDELEVEIERRIIGMLGKAAAVRITDPEGTHLEYPLTAEQANRWQLNAWWHGHLNLDPLISTTEESAITPVSPDVPPVFRDINGVLAGTSNHMGYIPKIEVFFEHGRLIKVKGGGKYGEMINEIMEKYKDVHWPGYPDKGFFWYCDCALCTVVKAFRRTSDMFSSYWRLPNITERNRAGIFHMGFGSRRHGRQYLQFARENGLSTGHIHVHNYFVTFEIKIRGTDYWYKIVDKGWLTAMDDRKIRRSGWFTQL
jgi:hypothetical protein